MHLCPLQAMTVEGNGDVVVTMCGNDFMAFGHRHVITHDWCALQKFFTVKLSHNIFTTWKSMSDVITQRVYVMATRLRYHTTWLHHENAGLCVVLVYSAPYFRIYSVAPSESQQIPVISQRTSYRVVRLKADVT